MRTKKQKKTKKKINEEVITFSINMTLINTQLFKINRHTNYNVFRL